MILRFFLQESLGSVAKIKMSLLNLVDLAGSEWQRDTRSAGVHLKASGDGVRAREDTYRITGNFMVESQSMNIITAKF